MSVKPASAGDAIPPKCEVIEVRVAELRQLFNAIDPSPFRERDLDDLRAERHEYRNALTQAIQSTRATFMTPPESRRHQHTPEEERKIERSSVFES